MQTDETTTQGSGWSLEDQTMSYRQIIQSWSIDNNSMKIMKKHTSKQTTNKNMSIALPSKTLLIVCLSATISYSVILSIYAHFTQKIINSNSTSTHQV